MTVWNWQKAMTLAERTRLHRGATAPGSPSGPAVERGRKRLARWKAQPPFDAGTLFEQRLDRAGLTEAELLRLLCDPDGAGLAWPGEPPAWAREIDPALLDGAEDESSLCSDKQGERPEVLFLHLVRPLIGRALNKLREGLQALLKAQPTLPFASDTVERLCLALLPRRLLSVLARTMALELNVARVQGLLHGQTTEERFASFIGRIRQPHVRLELFREYPVLARLVVEILENWVTRSMEVLQHWCVDLPAICEAFHPAQDPGPLIGIEGDAGDRHRGGRTVWILQCTSGFKVVYKPKPMAVDRHFQELLGWLNQRGLSAPFRPLRVLDRGHYGWEEFVAPHPCSSRDEVARFYLRTGGYLALLYALAATDFHYENLLALGEHPVLIDLEALFHPSGLDPVPQQAGEIAGYSLGESVLGSGLLPAPISAGEFGMFDLSGLGAEAGQKMPRRAPGWKGLGTDEMHFARQSHVIQSSAHRPILNGIAASPLDYLDEIQTGFRQVYRLLQTHRDELLTQGGPIDRFAGDEVRVVLRNSSRYAQLLLEGSHPDVLRDGLDRDRVFDRLWEEVTDQPRLAQLIPAEIEDLWRGDVPLFTTRPGSRDLWAGADRHFPAVLNECGLDRARRRLRQFGDADLNRQLWFLRGSLTTLASARRPRARSPRQPLAEPGILIDRAQWLAASCAVGERLVETALHGTEDVSWIGLNLLRQKQWILAPLGLDFYDGVPGIALFLAYLGSLSGQERYTTLARAALQTVRRRLDPAARKKGLGKIGGFVGWGGLLYLLAHLGVVWAEPALLDEARELVEELPQRIAQDKDLDIIGGAAGCIAALLSLQSSRPSVRVLELARQCGEHLLARVRHMPHGLGWEPPFANHAPLTGFSHGTAGISWALLQLAANTGEERFRTAALGGIAYERSLFSAKAENWLDMRVHDTDPTQVPEFPVGWCHGAPGIGLSRLLCRRLLHDPLFDAEIETALRTTMTSGFGYNHCLCHGDLGNLELFLEAARAWPASSCAEKSQRLAAGIFNSIRDDGWVCSNPLAVESPGLMTGLAGIGYGLLRCADPARVPSILSLAPPIPPLEHAMRTNVTDPSNTRSL
jgi:type 2 lantibiotic biosynthesis protein LanM